MNANHADGMKRETTARTAEDAPATPITGSRSTARIKIPVDRLPDAPDPTLPHNQRERIGIGAWIDHDYRVRMAMKKRNDRRDA